MQIKPLLLTNCLILDPGRRIKSNDAGGGKLSAESILLKDGLISVVGDYRSLRNADRRSEVIDLEGRTIMPGVIDSHVHLLQTGYLKTQLDLKGASGIDDIKLRVKKAAENKQPGEWIIGRGWDESEFSIPVPPNRWDLDQAAPCNPVFLIRVCTHVFIANTPALQMSGLEESRAPAQGGAVYRDREGRLTGMLAEKAGDPIYDIINQDAKMEQEAIRAAIWYMAENGITTAHSMAIGIKDSNHYARLMDSYREVLREEGYPLRIILGAECELLDYLLENKIDFLAGDPFFRQGYIKFFLDGSLGGRTALLKNEYCDDPGNFGMPVMDVAELEEISRKAHKNGYQCAFHAIGDQAAEHSIRAVKSLGDEKNVFRHRMVHASVVDEVILDILQKYKIGVDIQPGFLSSDYRWLEKRLGPERMKRAYIWKTMIKDKGLLLAGSSDAPVEDAAPFASIQAAVTRRTLEGEPEGGFLPEESLQLDDMLKCYTVNGAYQYFEENVKGSIAPGMLADLAVLSDHPHNAEPHQLKNIHAVMTIVGGRIIYQQ